MRSALATILLIGLPAVAAAQPVRPGPAPGSFPRLPPIGLPLPPIGLPLPQIGLPLPPTGLGQIDAPPPGTGFPPSPESRAPNPEVAAQNHGSFRINHPPVGARRQRPSVFYVVPTYGVFYEAPTANGTTPSLEDSTTSPPPQNSVGQLQLEISPTGDQQQIFVDGAYVGTFKDFSGEMQLDAGLHTIDIQASGYETLHMDVNIFAGRSIAYRGTLTPASPPSASSPPVPSIPATSTTIYVVPGCYIGNVPPQEVELPAGCDASRVVMTTLH